MNQVCLIGRLGKDPELKITPSNTKVCRFSLAVSDVPTKDGQYHTNWINCVAFGKSAENFDRYARKGAQIAVNGRIKTGSYDREGQKVYTTDIMVATFQLLGGKNQSQEVESTANRGNVYPQDVAREVTLEPTDYEINDDDLPF